MTPPVKPLPIVVGVLTTTTYWGTNWVMWGFGKSEKRVKAAPETLQERLSAVETEVRLLKTEWIDTYEKLYRLAGRLDASRRWAADKGLPTPTEAGVKVPQNGSDEQIGAPPEELSPARARMSRSELLQSLTR